MTLNSGSALYALVKDPSGTVFINGNSQLIGTVACDRLTVNSGGLLQLTDSALPPVNQPPTVSAGSNQTITLPNSASLSGSATDDGLPAGSSVTVSWTKVSGPGTVTFANASSAVTTAAFSQSGTYALRLTASDSQLSSSSDVTITVNPQNHAPSVNAGPDQPITLPNSATLNGTATDDGLPAGTLAISWSKVSGPGTVTFTNPTAAVTGASFSVAGTYALRLTANDSQLSTSDDVVVTVIPQNHAPTVNAGSDQTIALPSNATLNGTATDDGLPAGSTLAISWTKVSGPGTVTFTPPNAATTSASFSSAGTYTLRLTANDSQLSTSDDVVVTVTPQNRAPTVDAGPDQTISLPNSANLNGSASDDGYPSGSSLTTTWTKVSGPGTATFGNPNVTVTSVSFSQAGTYVLRLTGSDTQLSTSDDITITVNPQNQPPSVNAGADQTISLPNAAQLNGTATDDGLPTGSTLSISWSKVSGPGTVTFGSPNASVTSASFSVAGTYTLRLTANDSQLSTSDDVVVTVNPQNQAPTVDAGPDQTISLPNAANLNGSASDDGYPSGSSLTTTWSKVSGPGTATFGNPNVTVTSVSFSQNGTYVLRLTASDTQLSASDDITITVNPQNQAPTVNAGADQTITFPNTASLNGSASDDGYPSGGSLTTTWSKVSGPGGATFVNPNVTVTSVSFSQAGTYVLRLTVSDTELSASDEVTILVSLAVNQPPSVDAGADQTVSLPNKNVGFFLNEMAAFNVAAGTPPVVVDFDNIAPGTDITGATLSGMTFDLPGAAGSSAPLIITQAADTFTPGGFGGVIDASTNKLPATSGVNVLSPGGPELGPGFNPLVENDDLKITFAQPVSAVGFDLLFQELDFFSAVRVTFYDVNGNILYNSDNLPTGSGQGGGAPGGAIFVGFVSTRANIAKIIIDEYDDNNQFPDANIGFDTFRVQRLIPASAFVNLSGVVRDDGLPAGNSLRSSWTRISGPGSVTFADPQSAFTRASFSEAGLYTLRLTADDSELTASDDVTVTVNEGPVNYPPTVSAGDDQTIPLPQNFANLAGSVADDGQPVGSSVAIAWSVLGGPGNVTFTNPNTAVTTATFSGPGDYVLRLSASDSQLAGADDVLITVVDPAATNQPPRVDAGPDQALTLPDSAQLRGTVRDDGLPLGSIVAVSWSKVSGEGNVSFGSVNAPTTTATFSAPGVYVLRLTGSDSQLTASDDVRITVATKQRSASPAVTCYVSRQAIRN